MFKLKSITFKEQFLTIRFSGEKQFETLVAEIRLKDMTRYTVKSYTKFYKINITGHPNEYEIRLDYSIFTEQNVLKNLTNQEVWIYIYNGEKYYELKVDSTMKEKIDSMESMNICKVAQINAMIKSNNTLALNITQCKHTVQLSNIEIDSNHMVLSIKTPENELNYEMYLKKRIFKDTLIYSESILLKKIEQSKFILPFADLENMHYDSMSIFDFMMELTDKKISIDAPITSNNELTQSHFVFSDQIKSKLYLTKKKHLAIKAEKHYPAVNIQHISKDTFEINLSAIDNQHLDQIKCGLFRISRVVGDAEMTLYKELDAKINSSSFTLDLNTDKLFSEIDINHKQLYTIMLYTDNGEVDIKFRLSYPEKMEFVLDSSKFDIRCIVNPEPVFTIKPIEKSPVRVSILGSCYSRAPFNSSNSYFNPDYKKYFNIVYSHFWISLISATSKKIEFNKMLFNDVPEKEIMKVAREYEKTTFEDLQASHTDYVIIDLFVDAVHGCRKLPDGRYIGQNGEMHKSSYYKHHLLKETSQFDNRNPQFWKVWQSACDEFIARLLEVVDKDKIILNWGGLSDGYKDDKDQVSSFSKDKKFSKTDIKFINHTWDKMNNYFITKVPSTKVVDLREYNYKASLEYPYGGSGPHHYERNYYKSFLGELSKLVLGDRK